jgi:hypothetical protein
MPSRISTLTGVFLFFIIFSSIAIFFPGKGPDNQVEILFGATTFVFGIITAFFISINMSRLQDLSTMLNSENANLIMVYKLSKLFTENEQKKVERLLDEYLVSQIDYYLQDYQLTRPYFDKLSSYLLSLKPHTKRQEEVYNKYVDILANSETNRMKIISLTKQGTAKYEWMLIILLATITLFSLFYLNNGSLMSIIFTILLATAIVSIILILRDLSSLRWREQKWIWNNLDETFKTIGLTPYYPVAVIKEKRAKIKHGQKVRLASYPTPYPDMTGKQIKEVQL